MNSLSIYWRRMWYIHQKPPTKNKLDQYATTWMSLRNIEQKIKTKYNIYTVYLQRFQKIGNTIALRNTK